MLGLKPPVIRNENSVESKEKFVKPEVGGSSSNGNRPESRTFLYEDRKSS